MRLIPLLVRPLASHPLACLAGLGGTLLLWVGGCWVALHPPTEPLPLGCVPAVLLGPLVLLACLAIFTRSLVDAGTETLRPDAAAQVLGALVPTTLLPVLPALLAVPLLGACGWSSALVVLGASTLTWWLGWSLPPPHRPQRPNLLPLGVALAVGLVVAALPTARLRLLFDHPDGAATALLPPLVLALVLATALAVRRDVRQPPRHPRLALRPPSGDEAAADATAARTSRHRPLPPLTAHPVALGRWLAAVMASLAPSQLAGLTVVLALVSIAWLCICTPSRVPGNLQGGTLGAMLGATFATSIWDRTLATARSRLALLALRPVSRRAFARLVPAACALRLLSVGLMGALVLGVVLGCARRWDVLTGFATPFLLLACLLPLVSALWAWVLSLRRPQLSVLLPLVLIYVPMAVHPPHPDDGVPYLRVIAILGLCLLAVGMGAWILVVRRWERLDLD